MWKHLTKEDRYEISILYNKGYLQCEIVRELWIRKDIVSKEIKRNSIINRKSWEKEYKGKKAQIKHYQRRRKAKHQGMKINSHTSLKLHIIKKLKQYASPEIIADNWNSKKDQNITITAESIYTWLNTGDGNKYKKYLLYQNWWYRKNKWERSMKWVIPHRVWIEERPLEIWDRSQQWHYEADLIVSKKWFKGVLLTLIDRKTRKGQIVKLRNKKTKWVMSAIKRYKDTLGIKSITFDNGREFYHHYKLRKYGIDTFFCDTYASRQKGSVENYNGIIRRWFPKWTVFDDVSHNKIKSVTNIINNTPRKILWFKSPNQVHT